jgi:hypothetical protein
MQVERQRESSLLLLPASGGRVSNAWEICPVEGDNSWKRLLIPHTPYGGKQGTFGPCAIGYAQVGLASW